MHHQLRQIIIVFYNVDWWNWKRQFLLVVLVFSAPVFKDDFITEAMSMLVLSIVEFRRRESPNHRELFLHVQFQLLHERAPFSRLKLSNPTSIPLSSSF